MIDWVEAQSVRHSQLPLAIGQIGQTLDGRIATASGQSHYVNGAEALDHLHRLRALVDAVIVGAGTVAADDPRLTVRRCAGRNPVRVVLDPGGRVPPDRALFSDGAAPTWVVGPAAPGLAERLVADGSEHGVLAALAARGIRSVLVEGGARTLSAYLGAGLLDRLHVLVAPKILGSGLMGVELQAVATMDAALTPRVRLYPLGTDTLFDCDLRDQGAGSSN